MVKFVVPTYALVVTNMLLSALDKAFIGQGSSLQLAALGPSTAVFDCSSYLLTFMSTATLTLLRSQPGPRLNTIRSHALAFTVALGSLQGAALLLLAAPAVRLLGASGAMLPYSVQYLRIRALGAPVERLASIATQFFLAERDGVAPMLATLIASAFNAVGDYLLCPRYGVAGAAAATVAASGVSAAFLTRRLQLRGLWPRPLEPPRPDRDFAPFAAFAGPLLVVLLAKVLLFALMTAGATALGTAAGAAHQVLVSVFFVCGIAFGQPLSWAAQAFLGGAPGSPERGRASRALRAVAAVAIGLSGVCAGLMARYCLGLFTADAAVRAEAAAAAPVVVAFVMLYVLYLTLEGAAIAMQRLRACLAISVALAVGGGGVVWALQHRGLLTLTTLWGSQALALVAAAVATAAVAAKGQRGGGGAAGEAGDG